MKIIREITFHEMLRRFAVGEVRSYSFYKAPNDEHRKESLCLLMSGEQDQEHEGIHRVLEGRRSVVNNLLQLRLKYYLANLPITHSQFSVIKTYNDRNWVRYSGGTRKLIDAASYLRDAPGEDNRVDKIISAFKRGDIEMQGITLVKESETGFFTIFEGNARLVAVYLCCVDEQSSPICKSEVEVVLGISAISWEFS